ncbi:deoxyribose-phosphate aldolase [Brevibacillus choshinensis]|uniref:deoxyribose-phosphate aldolase n=1 Tax=Brevibacillus choshinensis TaxID=54911 RepID=UPI002E1FE3CA|nr:deoxyribose-phosphate aldolase [Brevibacillus choshinensis]MED4582704.1 deoxyribose-phosphate aldolase [Brevibacillus choshinensis]
MERLNGMIDHTLLRADATKAEIAALTEEAKTYEFATVCVNPAHVSYAAEQLAGSKVKVCTVIGFPLGASTAETKAFETRNAIDNGAAEVDMVINIGALKAEENEVVEKDIQAVVSAAEGKALVKVILETSLLTEEEIVRACQISQKAGADYVKTSTGFSSGGATVAAVALMCQTVGAQMGVKASGGVRSLEDMKNMMEAGATRIGTSSGVKIMEREESASSY